MAFRTATRPMVGARGRRGTAWRPPCLEVSIPPDGRRGTLVEAVMLLGVSGDAAASGLQPVKGLGVRLQDLRRDGFGDALGLDPPPDFVERADVGRDVAVRIVRAD